MDDNEVDSWWQGYGLPGRFLGPITLAMVIIAGLGATVAGPATANSPWSETECIDLNGDGWGWIGIWPAGESCEVGATISSTVSPAATEVSSPQAGGSSPASSESPWSETECIDLSGDGWGWIGIWPAGESCEVEAFSGGEQVEPTDPSSDEPTTSGKPRAVVSIGDSYISGEAGRWTSNGIDRGVGVYGATHGTNKNFCHRSDVAPIKSANIPVDKAINLACSGATSDHVRTTHMPDERPQIDQLVDTVRDYDVEMVVISIGGNDAKAVPLATYCGWKSALPGSCKQDRYHSFHEAIRVAADEKVDAVVEKVLEVVEPGTRVVLQSYVSPYGNTMRYNGTERYTHGCPIQSKDRLWFRNEIVQHFDDAYHRIALNRGIEFLSLADAFNGKEVCAQGVTWGANSTDPTKLEWIRRVSNGRMQESLHPTALGQEAMGKCLNLVWNSPGQRSHKCTNLNAGPQQMKLSRAPAPAAPVSFAIDNLKIENLGDSLRLSARVTADRNSPDAAIYTTLWLNGQQRSAAVHPQGLTANQPYEIVRVVPIGEWGSWDGERAQTGLTVDVREGFLFADHSPKVPGPTIVLPFVGP